ncbi:hypothetical protein OG618_33535 [Kitasatospora sp. NBC_01246]|uniref:TnsA endonuclease N-terminal domain-containing protein n=1 Tax=Kitasatospora sp. NBC_01246 TaxID=2903570 RepID=UPI002E36663B|nr:TnsA endonuclease N-terminal domain-containing protein [Kitasatospora sp. NBC_01246]
MEGPPPASRQGRAWSDEETGRLVDGVREGFDLSELAGRHGRTTGAIGARLARLVPEAELPEAELVEDSPASGGGPVSGVALVGSAELEWLRARLAADPDYPWRSVFDARRRPPRGLRRRRAAGHAPAATPGEPAPAGPTRGEPAAGPQWSARLDDVRAEWERTIGHRLRAERRAEFVARPVVADLAVVAAPLRQAAARRLWEGEARLLLDDWLLECLCPGASRLTTDWAPIAERDPDTVLLLRELAAAAAAEIPAGRSREIVCRRLGLHDGPAESLAAVGEAFGISRERVRQLQVKAVRGMASTAAPATRSLRTLLAGLSRVDDPPCPDGSPDGSPAGDGPDPLDGSRTAGAAVADPPASARLLDLAEVLLPAVPVRQAALVIAQLAGARKLRAENLAAEAVTVRALRHDAARRELSRQGRIERAARRWAALEAEVSWFGAPQPAPPRGELAALRDTAGEDGRSGSWHCPKLGREVAYESETEWRVVQLLSFAPQIAYYQEQPLAIGYDFDGRRRTYYPDLLVATTDGRCVLIEVKPVYEMATAVNVAKYRAVEALCRARGWGLVATDGWRTRRLLEDRPVDGRLEAALDEALARGGELTWHQVRAAAGALPLKSLDLAALVLRRGWVWRTHPYRLRSGAPASVPALLSDPAPASDFTPVSAPAPDASAPDASAPPPPPPPPSPGTEPIPLFPEVSPRRRVVPSPAEVEAARTAAGGWTRAQLAAWGVAWPAPKGWKQRLAQEWAAGR